jgi:phenylacetate-coenzyme A ligase PaaK-like adenylate-forming protein
MTTYTSTDIRATGHAIDNDRLRHLVSIHFDPQWGAVFWIDRARSRRINPLSDLGRFDDLALLGDLESHELQARPLTEYIPRRFHDRINHMILGQTGGTTGPGTWTAYRDDEFEAAFVEPFALAATHVGFPRNERWLFIGPSGPHIIAKAAPRLARRLDSPEPFSVDFDPRWARKLPQGSTAGQRYAQHIVEQALHVINSQDVGVLFATPPVLERLAMQMSDAQRLRIRGVHYGGVALDPALLHKLQTESFPNAVHLSGYGNTLLGCCLELNTNAGRTPTYFPHGERLIFETIDSQGHPTSFGSTGRLRVTRLDETMLIVRLIERDAAALIEPPADAPPGFVMPGVLNPRPIARPQAPAPVGLY